MTTVFTPSDSMRLRRVTLVTEEEAQRAQLSGDYAPEGPLDHLRRAELWLPTSASALLLDAQAPVHWYGLSFQVGIVPPGTVRVSSAEIRALFEPPVSRLGAWSPNDKFVVYRETRIRSGKEIKADVSQLSAALAALPGIADLLPQLSAEYHEETQAIVVPQESVIRTVSDGERRLAWTLFEDPQSRVDPRQLTASVVVGLPPGVVPAAPVRGLRLEVACRCGALRMRSAIRQSVDLSFSGP